VLIREIRVQWLSWFQPQIKCKKHGKHQLQTRAPPGIPAKADTPEKPMASIWEHDSNPSKKSRNSLLTKLAIIIKFLSSSVF
jgi:hypothetical protein